VHSARWLSAEVNPAAAPPLIGTAASASPWTMNTGSSVPAGGGGGAGVPIQRSARRFGRPAAR